MTTEQDDGPNDEMLDYIMPRLCPLHRVGFSPVFFPSLSRVQVPKGP